MTVLRDDLLQGRGIALGPGVSDGIAAALGAAGGRVEVLPALGDPVDDQVGEWARAHAPLDVLVYVVSPSFGAGSPQALTAALQDAWVAIRELAVGALIDSPRPGKIVLLGPPAEAGAYAQAAGAHAQAAAYAQAASAALENLARTLSVEWARHGITTVMVAPGEGCGETDLAQVICFLCSVAGDYFSGCRLEVG